MSDARRYEEDRWQDPIVAEVRAAREALLEEVGYDLHALCEKLRERQRTEGRAVVRHSPRPADGRAA